MLLEKDASFWKRVGEDPAWEPMVREIRRKYDENFEEVHPALSWSLRHIYYETGSRVEFETPYFRRRRMMSAAAILSLIYPEEEHYLTEVIDAMFAVLDEYCWALPAHTAEDFEENDAFIDLFSAETGCILAEIMTVLSDRLPELLKKRIRKEFHERITRGMELRSYGWQTGTNNWSAVCAGAVGIGFMYLEPDSFERYRDSLLRTMEGFKAGYAEDGTCLEGTAYWHYGFGYFYAFADLLYRYSDGKDDLFADPKVERMAAYLQHTFMMGPVTVSYGDGEPEAEGCSDYGMQQYLHRRYPDTVRLLPDSVSMLTAGCTGFLYEYRNFMFFDPELQKTVREIPMEDVFLPDAAQAVLHRRNYSLAAKAGANNESHNHNDIGNFIVSTKDGQILVDLGCGLYTREYFLKNTRYLRFCNNSSSHNVPIINGELQKGEGPEFCGTIQWDGENCVDISFAEAYGMPELRSLKRHLEAAKESVKLTDRFEGEITEFTERFVTLDLPVFLMEDGRQMLPGREEIPAKELQGIRLKGMLLRFGETVESAEIHTEKHLKHYTKAGGYDTVYCISLRVRADSGVASVEFIPDEGKRR